MTISVTINNPVGSDWDALIERIDTANGEEKTTSTSRVIPGQSSHDAVWSSRKIVVTEVKKGEKADGFPD